MDPQGEFAAELIATGARALARGIVERQAAIDGTAVDRFDAAGIGDLANDTELRLAYLAEALAADRPLLFHDYLAWLKVATLARGIPLPVLAQNLECMARELDRRLPDATRERVAGHLAAAQSSLAAAPSRLPSVLAADMPHVDLARRYLLAVLEARGSDAIALVRDARAGGVPAAELYEHVIGKAQQEIGRMWQMDEVHVGEEHLASSIAGRAMAALHEREPRPATVLGRVLCTSVVGDLHDLGIRAVGDHLSWAGHDVVMLGASTPAADLVYAVVDFAPDVVALSASLALQVRATARLIRLLHEKLDAPPPILVGGRPFALVSDLGQVVGADATAVRAGDAAMRIAELQARP